jgi:hypothetical protein
VYSPVNLQQAELGEGCLNLIKMHEILLTKTHLALVLEYASGAAWGSTALPLFDSHLLCPSAAAVHVELLFMLRCQRHQLVLLYGSSLAYAGCICFA